MHMYKIKRFMCIKIKKKENKVAYIFKKLYGSFSAKTAHDSKNKLSFPEV
jgi:hypothetical protein